MSVIGGKAVVDARDLLHVSPHFTSTRSTALRSAVVVLRRASNWSGHFGVDDEVPQFGAEGRGSPTETGSASDKVQWGRVPTARPRFGTLQFIVFIDLFQGGR